MFCRRVGEQPGRLGEAGDGGDQCDALRRLDALGVGLGSRDIVLLFQICDCYPREVQATVEVDVDYVCDARWFLREANREGISLRIG